MAIKGSGAVSPEERQFQALAVRIQETTLLSEILKNPKLLSELGAEVVRINGLNEQEKHERDEAAAVLAKTQQALAEEQNLYASLEELRHQYLADHQSRLREVNAHLEHGKDQLSAQRKQIEQAQEQERIALAKKAGEIEKAHDELRSKADHIASLHAELDNREAALAKRGIALDKYKDELEVKQSVLDERHVRIENLKKALAG